jgi:salicylate hydroxylase
LVSTFFNVKQFPQHDDLHQALYELATTAGATVSFNKPVKSVHVDEDKQAPVVVLEDGSEMTADLVIGADGYRSVVREVVAPEATAGTDSHRSMYTCVEFRLTFDAGYLN